jgi:hypothetical protein
LFSANGFWGLYVGRLADALPHLIAGE